MPTDNVVDGLVMMAVCAVAQPGEPIQSDLIGKRLREERQPLLSTEQIIDSLRRLHEKRLVGMRGGDEGDGLGVAEFIRLPDNAPANEDEDAGDEDADVEGDATATVSSGAEVPDEALIAFARLTHGHIWKRVGRSGVADFVARCDAAGSVKAAVIARGVSHMGMFAKATQERLPILREYAAALDSLSENDRARMRRLRIWGKRPIPAQDSMPDPEQQTSTEEPRIITDNGHAAHSTPPVARRSLLSVVECEAIAYFGAPVGMLMRLNPRCFYAILNRGHESLDPRVRAIAALLRAYRDQFIR